MKDKTIKSRLHQLDKNYKFILYMLVLLELGIFVSDHVHNKEEKRLRDRINRIDKQQIQFTKVLHNFGSKIIEKKILTVEEWKDVFDAAMVKPDGKRDAIWIRNRTLK